ncbi:hypothetical protein AF335_17790 [Streptomyces eurocidicus]|uniref:Uncharacterized protein n=1 Tax=Streptomyces eurocidicus TaxID=66423 RepID=A0A2N8NUK4_STREU|nr:hypothetical protein [Streptomyces eurocidicus]MBB5120317.1 hypothetical protein [Streptomyces eurocidicus]MBF6056007.1 hypothetical protein [Streptomyces eurocidicus]PNE32450.1 hypothetical protein AF335_17790 [Streptomyces eurocidicus]
MGTFAGSTARLTVANGGEKHLELAVEPWADIHRIPPEQARVVVTHSPAANGAWNGTAFGDEPFQVEHRADSVTVWANGHCYHISDREGHEIQAFADQCPVQGPSA